MDRLVKYELKTIDNKKYIHITLFVATSEDEYYHGNHDVLEFIFQPYTEWLSLEANIVRYLSWNWYFNNGDNLVIVD